MWASSWIVESFFPKPLYLQIPDIYSTEQSSLCKVHLRLQSYSVWFPSRAKRTTPPLLRGSALSSSGCGSPPAAPWEWWWLGRRSSSLASLGGSTWLRYQRRRRQKETRDEALLSGEHQQVTGWSWAEPSTLWPLISEDKASLWVTHFASLLITNTTWKCLTAILIQIM